MKYRIVEALRINEELMNSILEKTNVMTSASELFITSEILKIHNPVHIVELGAGAGGWAAALYLLGNSKIKYTLIENMSWGIQGFFDNNENFPKTLQELEDLVLLKTSDITNFEFFKEVEDVTSNNFDVFRYDCNGITDQQLNSILKKCHEKSVIFIDDFKMNVNPIACMQAMELHANDKLYPLWFSDKESAWCNNKDYRDYIYHLLYKKLKEIPSLNIKNCNFNEKLNFITSREMPGSLNKLANNE